MMKKGLVWVGSHKLKVIGFVVIVALFAIGVYNFAILVGGQKAYRFGQVSMIGVMRKCKKKFKKDKKEKRTKRKGA